MKRINYPARNSLEFLALKEDYKSIYTNDELSEMQKEWNRWKSRYNVTNISETVEELLLADIDVLVDVFERFKTLPIPQKITGGNGRTERSLQYKELDKIFKYANKYDKRIAKFFCDQADNLGLCSCSYCELAYINSYELTNGTSRTNKHHFDIDHYLPKMLCPILGLSLFNFVPSCQVCNSRIKSSRLIGTTKAELVKYSPVSDTYAFDSNVKICLRMRKGPNTDFRKKEEYYIHFKCKNNFREIVDFFHLEERYEFHKLEAMRIKQIEARYPQSARKMIAHLLGCSETKVREDLFHENYLQNNNRCFSKLTRDMLH